MIYLLQQSPDLKRNQEKTREKKQKNMGIHGDERMP
jgi:hypothetical protein